MFSNSKQLSQIKAEKTCLNFEPGLDGGYNAIYHNKIPMDIRYIDYDRNTKQIGGSEIIVVKIYGYGVKNNLSKIKLQLGSQYDPFLNLIFECDGQKYEYMKSQQGIIAQFQQFPTVLIKCFNKIEEQCCCRNPDANKNKGRMSINLLVGSDGKAKLIIRQGSEYKTIQIMSMDLLPQNEQSTQQKVSYKYKEMKNKVERAEQRLSKIQEIIKLKNPTLLSQIVKTHGNGNGNGNGGRLNISGI